ncbi:MAG: hypothetical protein EO766_12095 [Hydrotalea sp. AMD]|uniref:hypothetical protein n=1 Tax=Hydrotalea sp. AMD TaxID=2501297 RepID=UPI001025E79E|nr:hypothetical protein [Hydrotalea sp. AMD]RWZ87259.1 MAG: hypothetical protein EO766_12095 [Hydrotalea sp. AMD]
MNNIEIKVTGPGGCIEFEAIMIERLFKDLGYTVNVTNNCPYDGNESIDEFVERCKTIKHKMNINLVVDNRPWGG